MVDRNHGRDLRGPNIEDFRVVSWHPGQIPEGNPEAVAIVLTVSSIGDLVVRMKSPDAVDRVIDALRKHRRDVWPDADE